MNIKTKYKFAIINITILIGGVIMLWSTSVFSAGRPSNLGLKNKLLLSCPNSPNCVLSQASDQKHQINPIYYTSSLEIAKERLNQVILSLENARIITQNVDYWHIEFTTRWLRFVDDVEFYFPKTEALIHLRSASRIGYWDLGVNRKRIEGIRSRFEVLVRVDHS